jgi:hypothetical protein
MNVEENMKRVHTEHSIKEEFEQTLPSRVERYLKVKPHGIVPYTEFAPASAECALLFRDGHFYGCIALSQAVTEAIARFLCKKNGWKPENIFEKNVQKLQTRKIISEEISSKFLKIWDKRDDYHHLNTNIETERSKLEKIAYEKALLLKEIESEIFKFSFVDGKLLPENKKYWSVQKNGTVPVFLKLE